MTGPGSVIARLARVTLRSGASRQTHRKARMRSDVEPEPRSTGPGATTAERRAGAELMKIRVLVAEDHPLVREGVIRALERDPGLEVVGEADNGVTAMELARQLKPDVMVLD